MESLGHGKRFGKRVELGLKACKRLWNLVVIKLIDIVEWRAALSPRV
ncbi:hypothetical protein A2U01_0094889, partial [Trifolium medium]|nr:hypothetical protein [Trifolium medium]